MNDRQRKFLLFMVDTTEELMLNWGGFTEEDWEDLDFFKAYKVAVLRKQEDAQTEVD